MASSKSSQTTRNVVIALLALWSVISLIIIVVWATSPDLKSASQCRAELKTVREKLEGVKVMWAKDRAALEELVEQGWANQTILDREVSSLTVALAKANKSLSDYELETELLRQNITVLENDIEEHLKIQANLTSEIALQKEHIEQLELNLTQSTYHFVSCEALRSAAVSQQTAAESQTKACESGKSHLQRQIQQCKNAAPGASKPPGNRTPSLYASPMALLFCAITLHLLSS